MATYDGFLGFDFNLRYDNRIRNSQNTFQGDHCYSPDASIVNSCNSGYSH